jgi:hypothetical protein
MTLTAILVYADDTNISVPPGSLFIAIRELNAATGLLEPWFLKLSIRINKKKNEELQCFPSECVTIITISAQ